MVLMHVMICGNSACIFTAQNKHCNRIASGLLLFLPLWLYKTDTLLEFGQREGLLYLQKELFKNLKTSSSASEKIQRTVQQLCITFWFQCSFPFQTLEKWAILTF